MIRYTRALTEQESDVLRVAAEMVRGTGMGDTTDRQHDQLVRWAMRLRVSHDALLSTLRLPPVIDGSEANMGEGHG